MLQFCANLSLLFTEFDLIDRFKAAKESGFDAIEIQFPYTLPAKKIKQALLENNLKLVLFNIDADDLLTGGEGLASVPEKQEVFIKELQKTKAYAEILQPEAINILPGRCTNFQRKTEYLNVFKKNLQLALNTFSPLGIKTVFEAINTVDMPDFIIHNGEQMLEIIRQIDHSMLFMQYDVYHMHKMKENICQFFKLNSQKIGHIQFADSPGRAQPGTGIINFEQLFSTIQTSNYKGWVGAEYKPNGLTHQSLIWFSKYKRNI